MILLKLIKQDFRNLMATPVVVTVCTVYPWLLIGVFGFVFSSLYGGEGVTSYDYYGVTMMMYLIISSITITPNTFMEKKLRQGNIRIAYAPISKVSIYMSKIISSFLFMGISFSINMLIMNYFNIVNFGGRNFKYVLILFMTFLLFTVTIGGAVCVIIKTEELTNMILSNIGSIFALLSGMFFPVDSLGKVVSSIANLSPIKWILDLTFNVIYDNNFQNYSNIIFCLILLSVFSLIVMHVNYKAEDYI
ncbi:MULTISPECIES: ABC transporter permease [unclassified Clostridium]|uniref:ABC transporter permease n=1 Tax=unclassified Clostridium TaxID=2614128 RepID=UPI0002986F7E|nr:MULTISPECIES: ABC transporter permease [unclassified Clostridium]EKQ56765.1 MAG: ABC-type polysaccharide/polyol phosphate export system, permease component [Clostridium sp. Maddingley MBC34-26]